MSEHYIQIDSTFRNRKENPNPFDFNVIVSNSGNSSNSNIALNPISNAYPIYNFQGPHPELLGIDKDFSGNDTQFIFGGITRSRFGGTGEINSHNIFHDTNNFIVPTNVLENTDISNLDRLNNLVNFDNNSNPIVTYVDSRLSTKKYAIRTLKTSQYSSIASIKFSPSQNSYGYYYNNGTKVNNVLFIGLTNNWGYIPGSSDTTFVTQYAMTYSWRITNNQIQIVESNPSFGNTATITRGSAYSLNTNDIYQIVYTGTNIVYYRNGAIVRNIIARESETTYGLSLLFTGYLTTLTKLTSYIKFEKYDQYNNMYTDTTNPWNITTQIGNNSYGPGTSNNPHLDGVDIQNTTNGSISYKTLINKNKVLTPELFNYSYNSANSYSKFPYASTVDKYYNGLKLCRYSTQSQYGNNSLESINITNYKSFDTIRTISDTSNNLYYDKGFSLYTTDIDTSKIVYYNGKNSCELDSLFSNNWNATDYWSINEGSLLSISNQQYITIHGGSDIDEYYTGYYLEDCTLPVGSLNTDPSGSNPNKIMKLNEYKHRFKKILSYDGKTKRAIISNKDVNGFPISSKGSNVHCIENNDYNNMNINSDRANRFSITSDESSLSYILGDKKYPNEFDKTGTIYTWQGTDSSGSSGWIPQDRYRIRKELPLVMGWGYNEDRDGARCRIGLSDNTDQNQLYTGTGPRNGMNGAVISFDIQNSGSGFVADSNIVYGSSLNNIDTDLYITVSEVDANGAIKSANIAWPGGNFKLNDILSIYGGDTLATLIITEIGQSIDISNAFKSGQHRTTGTLSNVNGEYDNKLVYIPSKGPEKKSSQYNTKYHLTGRFKTNDPHSKGKDPPYINQFPQKLKLTDVPYTEDDTGVLPIRKYITSNASTLKLRKTISDTSIINSDYSSIWKGSPGYFNYSYYDSINNIQQKEVWTFPTYYTWNGNNSINDGKGYLAIEDDYNQSHLDLSGTGVVTEQYLNSGSYNIVLDAYRSITGDFTTDNIKTLDISGAAVIMIQNPDLTYINNLPNPYNGDTTMSTLSNGSTNNIHTIPITVTQNGTYKIYLKFVGATASTTTNSVLNSTNTGGGKIDVVGNASPSFYKDSNNIYHLFVGKSISDISGINHYINSGTTTNRYLESTGYAPNQEYVLRNSWGYADSNSTFKNPSLTTEKIYKSSIQDASSTHITFIGWGDGSTTSISGYNINGNISGYFYNSNDYVTDGVRAKNWETGYTSSNLIKASYSGVLDYIDVGDNAAPAFLKTGSNIDISGVSVPKTDLYVGNKAGNIRYFEYGINNTLTTSQRNYRNDWTDRGLVQANSVNIDVGVNASPSFADISGNGIMHMFVGDQSGNLTFFQNTGTNLIPIWSTGVAVRDSTNNIINVGGNAKPSFAKIRGSSESFDMIVGDISGQLHYYKNNGTGGPWSGASTWPFQKVVYKSGYLTDHNEPTNSSIVESELTLTNATDFSGNTTSAHTQKGRATIMLWNDDNPLTELTYTKKTGNILTLDGSSIPKNINYNSGVKVSTKNFPGTSQYSNQVNTWNTPRSYLSPWSRGWIIVNSLKINDTTTITENRNIVHFGQNATTTDGQQWNGWINGTHNNSVTTSVISDRRLQIQVDSSNNMISEGYTKFYIGSLASGNYKLLIHASCATNNATVKLNSVLTNDNYNHELYNFENFSNSFEQQGAVQNGILNRGINYNGNIIGFKSAETKSILINSDKKCYQYIFNSDGRPLELKLGFINDDSSYKLNDTLILYQLSITKEEFNSDWIISNNYRDTQINNPLDNLFIDTYSGSTTSQSNGQSAIILSSSNFSSPVTGNVSNGLHSNTGKLNLFNIDVSGDVIKYDGNIINIGHNSSPVFFNISNSSALNLYIGQENGDIISYNNNGTLTSKNLEYNNNFPNGFSTSGNQQNWGNDFNNAVFKKSSITMSKLYYSNGFDTSGVTSVALIGWGENSVDNSPQPEANIQILNGKVSSYIYNSFSSDIENTAVNQWQTEFNHYLKYGNFDSSGNQLCIDVSNNASPALLPTGVNVNVNLQTDPISTEKINLYVGNGDGNIRYFEFGQITLTNKKLDFRNNWTDRGLIQSNSVNIDVGQNASPTFVDISGNSLQRMFIGNGDGKIHYYNNTGTNSSPVWISGGFVKDSEGNDIDVGTNAKPIFAKIRGSSNPYDLFIGSGNGNIYYYVNDGTGGPWSGNSGWPFKLYSYKNGVLTDNKETLSTISGSSLFPLNGYNRVGLRNSYNWEILDCNADGVNSLTYSGIDDTTKTYKYSIKLLNITIPNKLLQSSYYKNISSASYIYVQFNNLDNPTNNIILSNNPNSRSALFKVSIKNILNTDSKFCKLDGSEVVQTIYINPESNLQFKVFSEEGKVLECIEKDTCPPLIPDKYLQISALFHLKSI